MSQPAMLLLAIALGGCVWVPIPTPEHKVLEGTPVPMEQIEFVANGIEPNVTTRDEVVAHLGTPRLIWETERVYVYQWDMRRGVMVAIGPGASGLGDIPRRHWVLVQFDENDRVVRAEHVASTFYGPDEKLVRQWAGMPTSPMPKKSIVLLRLHCTIDKLPDHWPGLTAGMRARLPDQFRRRLIHLADAGFDSSGFVRPMPTRFVSKQAQDDDWAYFEREPGTYHLLVDGPNLFDRDVYSERCCGKLLDYRVDVPEHADIVYVGTLELTGTVTKTSFGMPTAVAATWAHDVPVVDERERASAVAAEHFADKGPVTVALMTGWQPGEPLVLRGL